MTPVVAYWWYGGGSARSSQLREQQGQALMEGLNSQSKLAEGAPNPGRVVAGITSTSTRVKLKPSLSASTGGAAAAKTTPKVGVPISRKRELGAGVL